ncbi:hypothetical protein CMV30_02555 [Nibricoccus aquaticus]|uniref:Uncharacterized protein n=1 Tax=Nibricoccus aquaticus TaxID=2576891 RepID=A0A290QF03_9BACT|nr:hypothetical protein CMV30_02555 [Nibricoccus aquaticus]
MPFFAPSRLCVSTFRQSTIPTSVLRSALCCPPSSLRVFALPLLPSFPPFRASALQRFRDKLPAVASAIFPSNSKTISAPHPSRLACASRSSNHTTCCSDRTRSNSGSYNAGSRDRTHAPT